MMREAAGAAMLRLACRARHLVALTAGERQAALRTEACLASNNWQLSESKESYVGGCGLFVLMLSHSEMNQRHRVMEALHAAQLDTKKKSQVRGARHSPCCPPGPLLATAALPRCPRAFRVVCADRERLPDGASQTATCAGASGNVAG